MFKSITSISAKEIESFEMWFSPQLKLGRIDGY
jgi:hypothetical protein